MNQPVKIFDHALLQRRLSRAQTAGGENFLLPHVVEDFADRLAAIKRNFHQILDVGTTSAQLSSELRRLFPDASVSHLAPVSSGMMANVETSRPLKTENLGLEPESLDLVTSALAFQAANDLPGLFTQIRRALKPDGLFLGCLFGGQTLRELRLAFAAAEAELSGGASPRVAPFADVRDLGGLLQRADLALPVADIDTMTVRYTDAFGLFRDLRAMGATNALAQRSRQPLRRAVLMGAVEIYQKQFCDPDGRVRATFDIVWLSGWAPHESQQSALKPGSARMRLADVLPTKTYGDQPG